MKLPVSINLKGKLIDKGKQIQIMMNNIVIGSIWSNTMQVSSTTKITIDV